MHVQAQHTVAQSVSADAKRQRCPQKANAMRVHGSKPVPRKEVISSSACRATTFLRSFRMRAASSGRCKQHG
eukprot:3941715-Rhodomonas_salina.4